MTSKKKPVLLGIAGVFVLYVLAANLLVDEPTTRTNRNGVEVMSPGALATVCDGKGGAEGTNAYDPSSDHHPMQVALESADGWSRMNPPYYHDGFEGDPAAEVELVACATRVANPPVERCRFEGGFATNFSYPNVEIEVREALTGELIDSAFIQPESRDCPFAVGVQDGKALTTSILPYDEIDEYLLEFTDPECAGQHTDRMTQACLASVPR